MGRRKINIQPLSNGRARSMTFLKRRNGLFKKAYELGVLCSVEIAVIVFDAKPGRSTKLFEYSSGDTKRIVSKYTQFTGSRDIKRPSDFAGSTAAADADEDESDGEDDHVPSGMTVDDSMQPPPRPGLSSMGESSLPSSSSHTQDAPRASTSSGGLSDSQFLALPEYHKEQYIERVSDFSSAFYRAIGTSDDLPPPSDPAQLAKSSPLPALETSEAQSESQGDTWIASAFTNVFQSSTIPPLPCDISSDTSPGNGVPSQSQHSSSSPGDGTIDGTPIPGSKSSSVPRWRPGGNPASFNVGVEENAALGQDASRGGLSPWGQPPKLVVSNQTGSWRTETDYRVEDMFE